MKQDTNHNGHAITVEYDTAMHGEYRKFKTEKGDVKWLNSKGYFAA